MERRRVDDPRLRRAIKRVLKHSGSVRTLTRLVELVNEELATENPRSGVSAPRVRRVAATTSPIKVKIHTRRGESRGLAKACPVCNAELDRVENQTLSGSRVTLQARCPRCPYWTGRSRRIPVRYTFHHPKYEQDTLPPG